MKITLYNVIVENIKTLISDNLEQEGSDSVNFSNYLCRLEYFIFKNVFKDFISSFSDNEKEFAKIFRGMLTKAKEYFHKKNGFVKSDDIIKYFEKFLWSIQQHAKRLGLFVPDTETAAPAADVAQPTAPPPPIQKTTVQSFANVKPPNLTDKNKKIYETIKTIETMLNDLKTLILEG